MPNAAHRRADAAPRGPVVDVDSHWTFPWEFRIGEGPLKRFAGLLPGEGDMMCFFLADDLLRTLPAAARPSPEQLFPTRPFRAGDVTHVPAIFEVNRATSSLAERLTWMDRIGIDYGIVNSGGFPAAFPLIESLEDRQAYLEACNDVLAEELDGASERLGAVTYADLTDLDWAIGELARMRRLGSRAFSIRGEPVGGLSLGHPHFDRLWSAVTDLGMVVSLHTGLAPSLFGDWGRLGLDFSTPQGRGRFLRMANSQRHQSAELFLSALMFGGVFERHPKLAVLVAELHVFWLPGFVTRMSHAGHSNDVLGDWTDELGPADYLRRQVRVSPLPGLGDTMALDVLEDFPDMLAWCSDYPHSEGDADPIALYGPRLDQLEPGLRRNFMGGNIAKSFDAMRDPIAIAA
jgi:predicted TIM-barrel fold metal-dependent hydrolase